MPGPVTASSAPTTAYPGICRRIWRISSARPPAPSAKPAAPTKTVLWFKPLPGRTNIVVTRQRDWNSQGAMAVDSLEWGCALCAGLTPTPNELWVIGGAQLFAAAMPLATRAIVTELDRDYEGDVFAPKLDDQWKEMARDTHVADDGMQFAFVTYERGGGAARSSPAHPGR